MGSTGTHPTARIGTRATSTWRKSPRLARQARRERGRGGVQPASLRAAWVQPERIPQRGSVRVRLVHGERVRDWQGRLAVSGAEEVCSQHPCAPHGFNRNASHSEDRYVCDCEGWLPDRTCAGLELQQRAETAESALLAQSVAYEALVARAYQEGWHECAEWAG